MVLVLYYPHSCDIHLRQVKTNIIFIGLPPSPNPSTGQDGSRLRAHTRHLRKSLGPSGNAPDSISLCSGGGGGDGGSRQPGESCEVELSASLEGNLATEASMVVLDTLDLIVQGNL